MTTKTLISVSKLLTVLLCLSAEVRLLSVSRHDKMIVVSEYQPPLSRPVPLMLDGQVAKITIHGKPGEWKDLSNYSLIHVRFTRTPVERLGVKMDGTVEEICIEEEK